MKSKPQIHFVFPICLGLFSFVVSTGLRLLEAWSFCDGKLVEYLRNELQVPVLKDLSTFLRFSMLPLLAFGSVFVLLNIPGFARKTIIAFTVIVLLCTGVFAVALMGVIIFPWSPIVAVLISYLGSVYYEKSFKNPH